MGRSERKTLFFSSLMARGSRAVGGSMATKARIWKRWVTTMSRKAPGLLVERGPRPDRQGLGDVDLDVVDVLAVPDGLEEAVGEPEGQDVLGRLLAQEVVDTEDLVVVEDLLQRRR